MELLNVFLKNFESSLRDFDLIKYLLRILCVLILEVAPNVLRNNFAAINIDEVKSEVKSSRQPIIEVFLRGWFWEDNYFTDYGKKGFS
jgi:hypothetical protein